MSLLWIEGFEGFGTSNGSAVVGLANKSSNSGADSNFTLRAGRVSGHSIEFSNTISNNFFEIPTFGNKATIIVGMAIKQAAYNAATDIITFKDGGSTTHMTLRLLSGGEYRVLRAGSTQIGSDTVGAAVSAGVWSYVEMKLTVSDAGGVVDLRVNGVQYLNLTSQDTRNGGNASVDRVRFTGSTNASDDTTIDDIYILDTSGSDNNGFLGSQIVQGLLPDGDGSSSQFTRSTGSTNYSLVDENPSNGDTDYVEDGTSGHKDLYTFQDPSGIQGVKGIQINVQCRETDANPFSILLPVKSGGTTSDGSAVAIGSTTYKTINRVVEYDPNTAALWAVADLAAAEIGVKVN